LDAPHSGELFERSFDVAGAVIELLAEVVVEGSTLHRCETSTLHLRDIAIFPAGTERASVGPRALLQVLLSEFVPELRGYGFDRLHITGTRLTGAHPGRNVDLTIDLRET
jgi:hypothetical protein